VRVSRRALVTILVVVALCAFAAATAMVSGRPSSDETRETTFRLLQANLCLSGHSGCYEPDTYPSVLDEAAARIRDLDPDAVTVNEACRDDAGELADRTGYTLTFAVVDYGGGPLPCIQPGGRGVFGIAVLTRDMVRTSHDGPFATQADPEERRWLCATTPREVTVCTAHLSTRSSAYERSANDAACRELRRVLAGYQAAGTTVFGGDLNRHDSCAPAAMWAVRDNAAAQSPGVQHIYGSRTLGRPSVSVAAATYTDHDFLIATAPVR
jgi:endonuclease/exonuclease/phosphatase family metal-dependent hydrolase